MSGWSYECPCGWKVWKLDASFEEVMGYVLGHQDRHLDTIDLMGEAKNHV